MTWDTGSHNLSGCDNYHIYSNARQGFFPKFCTSICEVVLKSHMKHWTRPCQIGSLWTRPCRAKPRPVSPHCHVRSAIMWDIIQHWVVIPYRYFGTTYQSHFKGQEIQMSEHSMTEVTWHNFLFGDIVQSVIFWRRQCSGSQLCFHFQQRSI